MRKFIREILLFLVVVAAVVVASAFLLPDRYMQRSMLAMQKIKLGRLRETKGCGRRIVFVGGSNLSHGMDSQRIEVMLNVRVVNMGLHGGLGFRYQLASIINDVGTEDIVVCSPEYGNFEKRGYLGSAEVLGMVCDIIPESKKLLSIDQWMKMAQYVPRYGAGKLCRLNQCFFGRSEPDVDSYNVQGDKLPPSSAIPLPQNKGMGSKTREDLSEQYMADLNALLDEVKRRGARVVFMPPVFQHSSYARQEPYIDAIAEMLEKNETPFLVPPRSLALDDKYFYDTPYHLNSIGYPIRTELVINALKTML